MSQESVYHEGELLIQQRAGQAMQARRSGAVISDAIPRGALPFIAQQRLAAVASVDPNGSLWSSILLGPPGFMSAPHERRVEIDLGSNPLSPHDPLWANLEHEQRVGLLIIDLASRRRLRVNGSANRLGHRLEVEVAEAYPNCPKYIQRRTAVLGEGRPESLHEAEGGPSLTSRQLEAIRRADTLFVASRHPQRGLDASHRGGMPGFVEIVDERTLRIPDYPGNGMFNTLGNFAVAPQAGLTFLDFEQGRLLQLTGHVEILWDQEAPGDGKGTGRAWQLSVQRWRQAGLPRRIEWKLLDYSPFNPQI